MIEATTLCPDRFWGPITSYQIGIAAVSQAVNQPCREANHSPLSCAEVKKAWSYTSTPSKCLHGEAFNEAIDTYSWCDTS